MLDPNMENEPELMLPCNIPEDMFDILFVQSHALLNSIESKDVQSLVVDELTNLVSDILRIYDIYDLYKDNMAALVVMYASWIILESLQRSGEIDEESTDFNMLFDNDTLMASMQKHQKLFEKTIQTIIVS
jgi:hypothetical protein